MKKAFITGLLAGALAVTPAMAWEKGENVPDLGKYDAPATDMAVYNTPIGPLIRQSYLEGDKPVFNVFSKDCKGKMQKYAYFDFDTKEVMLDNDPVDGVIDSVYKDSKLAPSPFAAIPKCE